MTPRSKEQRCRASSRTVLVADDDRTMARGLQLLLAHWGLAVTVVHDGAAALATARALEPELILLDLGLPRLDGLQVARALRGDQRPVRLVALTGYGDDQHRQLSREAGFNEHLVKPIDPLVLRTVLDASRGD